MDKYDEIGLCLWRLAINALLEGKEMNEPIVEIFIAYSHVKPMLRRLEL